MIPICAAAAASSASTWAAADFSPSSFFSSSGLTSVIVAGFVSFDPGDLGGVALSYGLSADFSSDLPPLWGSRTNGFDSSFIFLVNGSVPVMRASISSR